MNGRFLLSLVLTGALIVLASCGWFEEGAVRESIDRFYAAAAGGDLETALTLVSPENPTKRLLLSLRRGDEDSYVQETRAIAEKLQRTLRGAEIHLLSVRIEENRATARCLLLRGAEEYENVIELRRNDGQWLLLTLPELPSGL